MGLTNYDNWLADEGPDYCDECGGVLLPAPHGKVMCLNCIEDRRDADRDNAADFDEPEEEF